MPGRPYPHGIFPGRRFGFAVLVLALLAELVGFAWRSAQLHRGAPVAVAPTAPSPAVTVAPTTAPVTEPVAVTTATTAVTAADSLGAPVSTPGAITYRAATGTAVTVTAIDRCWVEARPDAGGPVLSDNLLTTGQTETFTAPVWLRFGDPTHVRATVGTTQLQLPDQGPGDLVLRS